MKSNIGLIMILVPAACVDRFEGPINKIEARGVSIAGFISDQEGPYEVRISRAFDIESKESMRTPISARSVRIVENTGKVEELQEISQGVYQTRSEGMRGVVGNSYRLIVELKDGVVFESAADTIQHSGHVDSLYFSYDKYEELGVTKVRANVLFDAYYEREETPWQMWKFTATFKGETHPEKDDKGCYYLEEIGGCNFAPPCSGYRNVGTPTNPILEQRYPCTCCICWYQIFNDEIFLSGDFLTGLISVRGARIKTVPITALTISSGIRFEVSQLSLSSSAYRFWKAIRDQKDAVGSLFQPITGRIPTNFVQKEGKNTAVFGFFYAAGISGISRLVKRQDMPAEFAYSIPFNVPEYAVDCRDLLPHSSATRPSFWKD
jgi:hypothetical protein